MTDGGAIRAVVFDIGGVVVEMGDIATLGPFGARADSAAIMAAWLDSPHVDAHERGAIDAAEFARRMVETHAIGCTADAFLKRCVDWHVGLFAGVEDVIAAIDPAVRVACLSNTSAFSWSTVPACVAASCLFATQFLSFRMGLMKPEAAIFRTVAESLALPAAQILFFDDTERHVAGARSVGFDAHRVAGFAAAREILERYGLLRAA